MAAPSGAGRRLGRAAGPVGDAVAAGEGDVLVPERAEALDVLVADDVPARRGSGFRWQTAGLDITSTVEEIDPPRRIVWGAPAKVIVAVHVWTLEPREDGVLVQTAESWEGEPVTAEVEPFRGPSLGHCVTGWRTSSAQPNRPWSAAHRRGSGPLAPRVREP